MIKRLSNSKYILILSLLLFSLIISSCSKKQDEKPKDFNDGVSIPVGET